MEQYFYQDCDANHYVIKKSDGQQVDDIHLTPKGIALIRSKVKENNEVEEKWVNTVLAKGWVFGKAKSLPRYFGCYNYKGGIGKTALTTGLGLALVKHGKKVLLIDADPQSSLSISFLGHEAWWKASQTNESIWNLYDPLHKKDWNTVGDPNLIKNAVKWLDDSTLSGSLGLMVGNPAVATLEADLAFGVHQGRKESSLKFSNTSVQAFFGVPEYAVSEEIDYVIFDAPPSFTLTTVSMLLVVDDLISPIDPDLATFYGLWIFNRLREGVIRNDDIRDLGLERDRFADAVGQCKFVVPSRYEGNLEQLESQWNDIRREPHWKSILSDVRFCGPGIPYNQEIARTLQEGEPMGLLDLDEEFSYFEKTAENLFHTSAALEDIKI